MSHEDTSLLTEKPATKLMAEMGKAANRRMDEIFFSVMETADGNTCSSATTTNAFPQALFDKLVEMANTFKIEPAYETAGFGRLVVLCHDREDMLKLVDAVGGPNGFMHEFHLEYCAGFHLHVGPYEIYDKEGLLSRVVSIEKGKYGLIRKPAD